MDELRANHSVRPFFIGFITQTTEIRLYNKTVKDEIKRTTQRRKEMPGKTQRETILAF
jgi:hypothetical protein